MTPRVSLTASLLIASLLGAGCAPLATAPALKDAKRTATKKTATGDSASPTTGSQNASETPDTTTPSQTAFTGRVLGLDGQGAAGVKIVGYLVSNNGGGLVSNNGGGLLGDRGASFRLLAGTALETVTDAEGHFRLADPEGRAINIEAVKDTELKALRFAVPADAKDVTFQLAPTGTITGKVTAPAAPTVTNFQGVDVYVPGTGYMAKTDASGAFRIEGVPVGKFNLYAEKTGLGTATASNVEVKSRETATASDMALSVSSPQIASVTPASGGPGTLVTVKGERFGATSGHPITVTVGGVAAVEPNRVDDQTLTFKVPDNAGSQGVVVTVNQIASQPGGFQAIASLVLEGAQRFMLTGTNKQLQAVAKDAAGTTITSPNVQWSVTGEGATITADGLLKATGTGEATVKVSSGSSANVGQSVKVTVVASADELPGDEALTGAIGLVVSNGTIYVAEYSRVYKVAGNGSVTLVAGTEDFDGPFSSLEGIVADQAGNLYVADDTRLAKLTPDGAVSSFAGGVGLRGATDGTGSAARFRWITDVARDSAGNIYCLDYNDSNSDAKLRKVTPAGVVTTVTTPAEALADGEHLAVSPDGQTAYVEAWGELWKVNLATGAVSLLAGDLDLAGEAQDGRGAAASFGQVYDMAVSPEGELYVADESTIRHVAADGTVTTLEDLGVTLESIGAIGFAASGELVVVDDVQGKVFTLNLP